MVGQRSLIEHPAEGNLAGADSSFDELVRRAELLDIAHRRGT
jgi:hypothetical protein